MLGFKFLFSLSLYIICIHAGFIKDKMFNDKVIHLDRINAECRGRIVASQGYFQGVKSLSTSVFIGNYTLVVKEGGFTKIMLTISIDRCRSKENLDTCEDYYKQPNIDFCNSLVPNNVITRKFEMVPRMVPPLKCPIKKGIYHAYNFTYDLAPFLVFDLDDWYWKVKTELFTPDQNKLISCMHMEGYFKNSKSRKN